MYFCDISHVNSWMLFIFSVVTIYHQSLMHVRSKFTPCQHQVNVAIYVVLNSLFLEIPTDMKSWRICFNKNMHSTHIFFNVCAVLTIVPTYQIIEIILFFLFLTKLFIFYPVAVTLFFPVKSWWDYLFSKTCTPPQEYLLVTSLECKTWFMKHICYIWMWRKSGAAIHKHKFEDRFL